MRLDEERRASRQDEDAAAISPTGELRLIFASTPEAVRRALHSTLSGLEALSLTPEESGTVELVLAEVMNNIVEHAYRNIDSGMIELRLRHGDRGLLCTVIDDGDPMPDGNPPLGNRPIIGDEIEALPEGGFGWFLIRELARDLDYRREGSNNRLDFRMAVGRHLRTS